MAEGVRLAAAAAVVSSPVAAHPAHAAIAAQSPATAAGRDWVNARRGVRVSMQIDTPEATWRGTSRRHDNARGPRPQRLLPLWVKRGRFFRDAQRCACERRLCQANRLENCDRVDEQGPQAGCHLSRQPTTRHSRTCSGGPLEADRVNKHGHDVEETDGLAAIRYRFIRLGCFRCCCSGAYA